MKLKDSLIAWNHSGGVIVVPLLTDIYQDDPSRGYQCTGGGCYVAVRNLSRMESMLWVLNEAMQLICFYDVPPKEVDAAFSKIDEYRQSREIEAVGIFSPDNLEIFRKNLRRPAHKREGYYTL